MDFIWLFKVFRTISQICATSQCLHCVTCNTHPVYNNSCHYSQDCLRSQCVTDCVLPIWLVICSVCMCVCRYLSFPNMNFMLTMTTSATVFNTVLQHVCHVIGRPQFLTETQSSAGPHSALVRYMWGRRIRGQVSSCSQRGGHCPRRLLQLVSCHQTKALLIANSWTAKGLANERRDGVMVFRRVARPNREELRPGLCPRISPWPASPAPAGAGDPEDLE